VIFRRYIDFNFFDYFIIKIPHILITSIFPIGMTFLFKEYYIQQGEFIFLVYSSIILLVSFVASLYIFRHPLIKDLRVRKSF